MAIDTREKRQSILAFGRAYDMRAVTPNASPDDEWRTEVGWLYPGIIPATPGGAVSAAPLVNGPVIKSLFRGLVQT